MNGPILFLRVRIFPRDFSIMDGNAKSLRVWPVGAVSNTTTLKSIELTNLSKKKKNKKLISYNCQLSCLQVENSDLTPAHAQWPTSHAWLKNVNYYNLNWHTLWKYLNSNRCEKRKAQVKLINDDTFLEISDFWKSEWSNNHFLRTSELLNLEHLRKCSDVPVWKIVALPG